MQECSAINKSEFSTKTKWFIWERQLKWKDIFAWLPIETIVKERQTEYYSVLAQSDARGESTVFVEFMLQVIDDSLERII